MWCASISGYLTVCSRAVEGAEMRTRNLARQLSKAIEALLSNDPHREDAALDKLMSMRWEGINELLVPFLGHSSPRTRRRVASCLEGSDRGGTVRALKAAFGVEPDALVRLYIVHALRTISCSGGLRTYVRALEDESEMVRWEACQALGELHDRRAAPALRRLLAKEQDWNTRLAACVAQVMIRCVNPAVLKALEDLSAHAEAAQHDQVCSELAALAVGQGGTVLEYYTWSVRPVHEIYLLAQCVYDPASVPVFRAT